ncbi:hypothetical protein V5O48_016548 [Marasmius crinis-equi]|uniref:Uncharacterized protein n=1 Tax=Marasmius crinis-equi TaxID=585013 RepID=A0ABR3ERG1_9AGAR
MDTTNLTTTTLTIDDFDAILNYTDQTAWTTPDPFSAAYNPASPEWVRGTWHRTEVIGERSDIKLGFLGSSISVYGHSGPEYGSYAITIDDKVTLTRSAYAASNASSLPYALYTTTNLTNTPHTLTLRNLGKQGEDAGGNAFLLDFISIPVVVGGQGGQVRNETLEETDPRIKYTKSWGNNKSGNFSGGGTTFTNEDGGSFELKFNASAIYILGDKKNDHGFYTVQLDSNPPETYSGVSGCSGVFGEVCEQQLPSIKYFASNLAEGEHTVVVKNVRGNPNGEKGVNGTYFDLDSIVLTIPDKYPPALNSSSSSGGSGGSNPSGTNTPSGGAAINFNGANADGLSVFWGWTLLAALFMHWVGRRV